MPQPQWRRHLADYTHPNEYGMNLIQPNFHPREIEGGCSLR